MAPRVLPGRMQVTSRHPLPSAPQVLYMPAWGETHVVLGAAMGMPYLQMNYDNASRHRAKTVKDMKRLEMDRSDAREEDDGGTFSRPSRRL